MCFLSVGLGLATSATAGAIVASSVAETAAIAGGILGTVGAAQQAASQQAAAEYQAGVERENARLAARQAENEGLQGNQELAQLRQKMVATSAAGKTGYASQGVVLGSGTTSDYEADIADAYDLDRRNLEYDIATRKYQLKVEAANRQTQANIYDAQASQYGKTGTMSLLTGSFSTISKTLDAFEKTPVGKNAF